MNGLSIEVVNKIEDLAVKAKGAAGKVSVLTLPGEPSHVYGLVKEDGSIEFREAAAKPASHQLASLEEAILFAKEQGTVLKTVVWFDQTGVVIVLDKDTRRDVARLTLNHSPQFDRLLKIERDQETFTQQQFRRLLKFDFAKCRPNDVLLNWVSDVQWEQEGATRGALTHGKVSVGSDIQREVMSKLGAPPEEIVLKVRVFDDPSLKEEHGIRCAFEIHPEDHEFGLVPLPLELNDAIEMEIHVLGQKLRSALECKVYRGTP